MTGVDRGRALREARAALIARPGLVGRALRAELAALYDQWLGPALDGVERTALIAVGGLGRREVAPYSDLDLVLVYEKGRDDVTAIADRVWYPIWDARVGLDHSVRTVDHALAVAADDLKAMLGLLDLRHVAGAADVSAALRARLLDQWRTTATKRVAELMALCRHRDQPGLDVAFALEPDLKHGRGGLRDWHALRVLTLAQLLDVPDAVRIAGERLLDVRGELQRAVGGPGDVLRQQEQAAVATALGWADEDALLRAVNEAGRTIGVALARAWRQVPQPGGRGVRNRRLGRTRGRLERVPVAHNVVSQGGEIVLASGADPGADPALALRAAGSAAQRDEPLAPFTVDRLVSQSGPLPRPWPEAVRAEFITLLGCGPALVPVLETLDAAGLLTRWLPEWGAVRFAPQRDPVHRYTVERHLMETAAAAGAHVTEVRRPDLLLVAALLHDIGKARGGDHCVIGAQLAGPIAARMGFDTADQGRLVALVGHHLLLAHTATRRDLDDPRTVGLVLDALGPADVLDELAALTRADAAATGPAAWSEWKARLISELVARVRAAASGRALPRIDRDVDATRRRLAEAGGVAVERVADQLVVAAADAPGLLSITAGVLALHSLDVRSATISTVGTMAVNAFVAQPRFGAFPELSTLRADLSRALAGTLPLGERLAVKEAAYAGGGRGPGHGPAHVVWFDAEATDAIVVEVRAEDSFGLLHRLTAALEHSGLDIRSAQISTLGGAAVDAFYVTESGGAAVSDTTREQATRLLHDAVGSR